MSAKISSRVNLPKMIYFTATIKTKVVVGTTLAMERMRKPNIDAYLTVMVTDKNGKVVYRRRYKSKSFVVGFLNALYTVFTSPAGSNQFIRNPNIVVGSGTAKPSINDTALESQIGNGTGAGQLLYGTR